MDAGSEPQQDEPAGSDVPQQEEALATGCIFTGMEETGMPTCLSGIITVFSGLLSSRSNKATKLPDTSAEASAATGRTTAMNGPSKA